MRQRRSNTSAKPRIQSRRTGRTQMTSSKKRPCTNLVIASFAGIALVLTSFILLHVFAPAQSTDVLHSIRSWVRREDAALTQRADGRMRSGDSPSASAPVFKIDVLESFPHDPDAFTQGLSFGIDGYLYESTGLFGRSSLRRTDVRTGVVQKSVDLRKDEFGEGVAMASGDRIVQVLWKVGRGYVYDRATMAQQWEFQTGGEAWGIVRVPGTDDLYLSDGSSTLKVLQMDQGRVVEKRSLKVYDGGREVGLLNELEIVDDELWANVYMSDFIARIDPNTGLVTSWLDCRGILDERRIPKGHQIDVLNGIAWDATSRGLYITGKLWPNVFKVRASDRKIADRVGDTTDAFFLDRARVEYIHRYVIA